MSQHARAFFFFITVLLSLDSCTKPTDSSIASDTTNEGESSSQPTPRTLTEDEIANRDDTEAKMLRGEYLHDGSGVLAELGDIKSVPALLEVLKKHPPYKNGTMVCTTAHALMALRKITGVYPGPTYDPWSSWWETYKVENAITERS